VIGLRQFRVNGRSIEEIRTNPTDPDTQLVVTCEVFAGDSTAEVVVRRHNPNPYEVIARMDVDGGLADMRNRHQDGEQVFLPRSTHVARYVTSVAGQATRRQLRDAMRVQRMPALATYGPLRSYPLRYDEPMDDIDRGPGYGIWWPISENWIERDDDGRPVNAFSPNPMAHGGKWIGYHTGESSPNYWWQLHCRVMDRMTCHYAPDGRQVHVDNMRAPSGRVLSERYVLGSADPNSSIPPDKWGAAVAGSHPMIPWQSRVGNAGYRPSHYCRAFRAAMHLAYSCGRSDLVLPDILAMAHDITYWLCPYKAQKDLYGPGENPWMYNESLAYRERQPQPVMRDIGWGALCVAMAMDLCPSGDFEDWATDMLAWFHDSVRHGLWQSQPFGFPGSGNEKYLVPGEAAAQEIEVPIALAGCVALAIQLMEGDVPGWLVDIIDITCGHYVAADFQPRQWWVNKVRDQWVNPTMKGPVTATNQYLALEIGYRFGSPKVARAIKANRTAFEDTFEQSPGIRPWAAGLLGAFEHIGGVDGRAVELVQEALDA